MCGLPCQFKRFRAEGQRRKGDRAQGTLKGRRKPNASAMIWKLGLGRNLKHRARVGNSTFRSGAVDISRSVEDRSSHRSAAIAVA
jgi:hypothetical protein